MNTLRHFAIHLCPYFFTHRNIESLKALCGILPSTSLHILYSWTCCIIESTWPCDITVQIWSYVKLSHNVLMLLSCTKIVVNAFLFAYAVDALLVDWRPNNTSICCLPAGIIIYQTLYNWCAPLTKGLHVYARPKQSLLTKGRRVYAHKTRALLTKGLCVFFLTHPDWDPRTFFLEGKDFLKTLTTMYPIQETCFRRRVCCIWSQCADKW